MKKFLLFAGLFCAIMFSASAQQAETSFYGSRLDKTYYVHATQPNSRGRYDLLIEMQSLDEISDAIYFKVESRIIPKWISTMQEVKETYLKWRDTAIENNVAEAFKLIKKCGIASFMCCPYFKIRDWHNVRYHPISFAFKVSGDNIDLVITTGRVTADDNGYIQSKGGVIILSSEEEIDNFISCFDDGWVAEYYATKKNTNDLFR